MQVKELINIINTFGANVIFDNPKDSQNRILAGGSPLYFTPVEGKERKNYEQISNKSEFISSTAAIHIIDLDINDLIDLLECDGTGIYEYTKEQLKPYYSDSISEDIVCVAFLFLHEVGHWDQFIRMDKNVNIYINKDLNLLEENFNKVKQLNEKRQERIKKAVSQCNLTTNEKNLGKQYMLEYRQIPKEKEADEFALKNMAFTLDKYKSTMNIK